MSVNTSFDIMNTGAALGATTTGETIYVGDAKEITAYLDVSAVSGTSPTLDAVIWSSADGTLWHSHTAFTQATGATQEVKSLANFGAYIRVVSTIGGSATPTVTFTLKGVKK